MHTYKAMKTTKCLSASSKFKNLLQGNVGEIEHGSMSDYRVQCSLTGDLLLVIIIRTL